MGLLVFNYASMFYLKIKLVLMVDKLRIRIEF
jgi:hypothetical protein